MKSRRIHLHRRSTFSNIEPASSQQTSIRTTTVTIQSPSSTISSTNGSSDTQWSSTSVFKPDNSSIAIPTSTTSTPSSQQSIPQASTTTFTTLVSFTSFGTSTVYPSPATTIVTSELNDDSPFPTSPPSSITPALRLASRDGAIILSLSILTGTLSILCAFLLWRRCKERDYQESLENKVYPISFHQSDSLLLRQTHGNTDSVVTNVNPETASPAEFKNRLRGRSSPSHRRSDESDSVPGTPITPTQNLSHGSPVPDVFDSRWPGRVLAPSPGGSGFTLDSSQIILISGDISHPSDQSDVGSGTRPGDSTTVTPHLARPDNDQDVSRTSLEAFHEITLPQTKGQLENFARLRDVSQTSGRTWDRPPPEDSEKAESSKTGPPAYSPDCMRLPMPMPFQAPIPGGPRPTPTPPNDSGKEITPLSGEIH